MLQDEKGNGVIMKSGAIMIFVADSGDAKTVVQMTTKELSLVQKDTGLLEAHGRQRDAPRQRQSAGLVAGNVSIGAQATAATPALCRAAPGRSLQERVHQPLTSEEARP